MWASKHGVDFEGYEPRPPTFLTRQRIIVDIWRKILWERVHRVH